MLGWIIDTVRQTIELPPHRKAALAELFRDLKGLILNVTHAIKRVEAERPDYQGALKEINQLESAFKSAFGEWERKLSGEIQRLKYAIETDPQKSLGAKNYFILFQFLFEAVFLSLIGGLTGLFLVYLITLIPLGSLEVKMTFSNIMVGLGVAVVIGTLSGIIPSARAASIPS